MKKILSTVLLTGLVFASTASAFAAEEPNLPYVEGLGYEVELLETNPKIRALASWEKAWSGNLAWADVK